MKKLFFIAAIASVALASCVKNEVAPTAMHQNEVTFVPVVGNVTKAPQVGEIGTDYSEAESFKINAWYQEDAVSATFDPTKAVSVYMNGSETSNLIAKFKTGNVDDVSAGTVGAWFPYTTDYVSYFWPKNGHLTFSAYSPAEASGTGAFDATTGLTITDFVVEAAIKDQYDLLFSDRTYNKKSSTESAASSTKYDGVDIKFHHALSSIVVKAKTAADYGAGAITITDVKLTNVYSKGTFSENLTTGKETDSKATATWGTTQNTEVTYDLYNPTTNISLTTDYQEMNTDAATNPDCILLPQPFDHTSTEVTLVVNYTVKNGDGTTLNQVATFPLSTGAYEGDLNADKDTDDTGEDVITEWQMGKRYTYNLTFTLETVYFAPTVSDWTPVDFWI